MYPSARRATMGRPSGAGVVTWMTRWSPLPGVRTIDPTLRGPWHGVLIDASNVVVLDVAMSVVPAQSKSVVISTVTSVGSKQPVASVHAHNIPIATRRINSVEPNAVRAGAVGSASPLRRIS